MGYAPLTDTELDQISALLEDAERQLVADLANAEINSHVTLGMDHYPSPNMVDCFAKWLDRARVLRARIEARP